MNNHDELIYIKIMSRILEKMSEENTKLRRELLIHRIVLILMSISLFIVLILGVK